MEFDTSITFFKFCVFIVIAATVKPVSACGVEFEDFYFIGSILTFNHEVSLTPDDQPENLRRFRITQLGSEHYDPGETEITLDPVGDRYEPGLIEITKDTYLGDCPQTQTVNLIEPNFYLVDLTEPSTGCYEENQEKTFKIKTNTESVQLFNAVGALSVPSTVKVRLEPLDNETRKISSLNDEEEVFSTTLNVLDSDFNVTSENSRSHTIMNFNHEFCTLKPVIIEDLNLIDRPDEIPTSHSPSELSLFLPDSVSASTYNFELTGLPRIGTEQHYSIEFRLTDDALASFTKIEAESNDHVFIVIHKSEVRLPGEFFVEILISGPVNTITGIIPITILPNLTGITNISWKDVSQVSFLSENGVNYKAVGDLSDQTSLQLNTTDQGSVQDLISDQSLYNVTWSVIFTDFQTEESTVLVSGKIAHEVSFIADQIGEYYRVIFLKCRIFG